ncbi:hypothetical protein DMN91_010542 [Ooceraea biroi]|uniref:G-protein coupled receptors family 2 profile 2 domain-containing protein n=1 Tax=Ooceraea biroi TaxID=2015173 RepID=A0A3L8D863_OOCBI|nr:G-protein coupled receptor Mth2 isoform X1 [Ooceraea biroi]XP_026829607.1 G-protein coupled receptor Mth2-like isoform X1 [Ooceraea biroi]RLU16474.1 hypothetical protein DMN91_010542 [Ooceraea biroi]
MLLLVFFTILVTVTALESNRSEKKSEESWKGNFTPYIHLETLNDSEDNAEKPLVPLCCHIDAFLIKDECVKDAANETKALQFPTIYGTNLTVPLNITVNDLRKHFSFVVQHPCDGNRSLLIPHVHKTEWYLLSNGSIIRALVFDKSEDRLLNYHEYCLARVKKQKYLLVHEYLLVHCLNTSQVEEEEEKGKQEEEDDLVVYFYALVISVPFLIATYLVYWLLPDLNNLHGLTLRGYVGCMAITNCICATTHLIPHEWFSEVFCIVIALIITSSFSASFFWLNVMCFDIWWTFGQSFSNAFCRRKPWPLQGNIKQREKKRFMMYSIYVWGGAFIHTVICIIMDFTSILPNDSIRPEFDMCWFGTETAEFLYFWAPISIIIVCNICLFIHTALKIRSLRKNIAQQLQGSESRRHDDNRQRFSLYLKLSVVMGLSWSMEIITWLMEMLLNSLPEFIEDISNLTNILQGLIIFIICVWNNKTWHLLLKRLGCQDRDLFCRKSTNSNSSDPMSMQKISTCSQTCHAQNSPN